MMLQSSELLWSFPGFWCLGSGRELWCPAKAVKVVVRRRTVKPKLLNPKP